MKVTRKVFLTILTFVLLFIAFGASTFAWFTLGIDANIENVKVNVSAEEGIEISTDGFNWRANLDFEDLTKDIEFADLTSINGYDIKNLDLTSPEANKEYFEKKIYIRMTQDGNGNPDFDGIMLSKMLGEYESEDYEYKTWISDEDLNKYGLIRGEEYIFDTINAVKVSFTKEDETGLQSSVIYAFEDEEVKYVANFEEITVKREGTEEEGYTYETTPAFDEIQYNIFKTTGESCKHSYEYKSAKDIYQAIEEDEIKLYYVKDVTATPDKASSWGTVPEVKEVYKELKEKDFIAGETYFDKDGNKNAEASDEFEEGLYYLAGYKIDEGLAYDYANEKNFRLVMPNGKFQEYVGKDDLGDYEKVAILSATDFEVKGNDKTFMYAEITIRIWLEGWDPDCINAIIEKGTEFSFTIKAYKEN